MRVVITPGAFTEYGGGLSIAPVGDALEDALTALDFGVSELEIRPYFDRGKPSPGGLEEEFDRFHSFLRTLPTTRYESTKRRLTVQYLSHLDAADALDLRTFSPAVFRQALLEIVDVFRSLEGKLKSKAGLQFTTLLGAIKQVAAELPQTDTELHKLVQDVRARQQDRSAALPWDERLRVEWVDYHPNAKTLLNKPFFWDVIDENAPHGNDTGADVLEAFKRWRAKNKKARPLRFLDKLLASWGFDRSSSSSHAEVPALPRTTIELTRDQAAIALAFALIKLEGNCDLATRQRAVEAIDRQSCDRAVAAWRSADERREALKAMRAKLEENDNR